MADLSIIVSEIELKLRTLLDEKKRLATENKRLAEENEALDRENLALRRSVAELQDKILLEALRLQGCAGLAFDDCLAICHLGGEDGR